VRDNTFFTKLLFWPLFGHKTKLFMEFKQKAPYLTHKEYQDYYAKLADVHLKRETDLNQGSIDKIINSLAGSKILDVGCGRGFLAKTILKHHPKAHLTGLDIYIPPYLKNAKKETYIKGNVEKLPFKAKSFDTVISTHTLEHVQNPTKLIAEMRRVAKKKIIIVTPKQREYAYTFDLHLNFFPYEHSLARLLNNPAGQINNIDNDWFYEEMV
jgi:ubiquinone/menaquinone biosynthesis C-methylase UbiE